MPSKFNIKIVASCKREDNASGLVCFSDGYYYEIDGSSESITPSFSSDGLKIVYSKYVDNKYCLHIYDITKKNSVSLCTTLNNFAPVFSRDSNMVTYSKFETKELELADISEIYCMNLADNLEVRLTNNNRMDCYPVFSNDNSVFYESGRHDEYFGIFKIDISSKQEIAVKYEPKNAGNGIPSLFDTYLTYETCMADYSGEYNIAILDLNTMQNVILTDWRGVLHNPTPRLSPCGKMIACHRFINSIESVLVVFKKHNGQFMEYRQLELTKTVRLPRWSSDSKCLVVEDWKSGNLIATDLDGDFETLCFEGYRGQRFLEIYNFDVF